MDKSIFFMIQTISKLINFALLGSMTGFDQIECKVD